MANRRLDAMFAERVLGIEVDDAPHKYTQSLDAAWSGVERTMHRGLFADALFNMKSGSHSPWVVSFSFARSMHSVTATGATPAIAVVKACLLACGVTQEEIDACE